MRLSSHRATASSTPMYVSSYTPCMDSQTCRVSPPAVYRQLALQAALAGAVAPSGSTTYVKQACGVARGEELGGRGESTEAKPQTEAFDIRHVDDGSCAFTHMGRHPNAGWCAPDAGVPPPHRVPDIIENAPQKGLNTWTDDRRRW